MKGTASIRVALCVAAATFALASAANATVVRTFVSASGNDGNTASNCGRTTPCRTFAAAYTVTSAGGEIYALDPAGYGPITITTALSIIGVDGAAIAVMTGTVGITVNASPSAVVIVRNVLINGAGASSTTGIQVLAGRLALENCGLTLLTTGLNVSNSKADVNDTSFIGNGIAISTNGTGADAQNFPATGGTTMVRISGGKVLANTTAFVMNNPGLRLSAVDNLITIFLYNQGGGYPTVVAGNTTTTSGTGASCTSNPGNCTVLGQYSINLSGANQN